MKPVPAETTLVIVGAWNPAILTPPWVLRYGLQTEEGQAQIVHALIPAGLNGAFEFPRFNLPGFQFTARPEALVLMPDHANETGLALIEDVASRVLQQLTHTPIGGIGHNFEFVDENPDAKWIDVFSQSQIDLVDAIPAGLESQRTVLATTFLRGNAQVNIQRYFDGSNVGVKFNFHHPVTTSAEALKVLSGDGYARFSENYSVAKELLEKLYKGTEDGQ
ncbi:hypothetical protein [Roseateles sp. P5_E1]